MSLLQLLPSFKSASVFQQLSCGISDVSEVSVVFSSVFRAIQVHRAPAAKQDHLVCRAFRGKEDFQAAW